MAQNDKEKASEEQWNDATKGMITEQYRELGNWARHYSVVRMTIGTFFVTTSFALVNFRWERPDPLLAVFIFLFFATGCAIFLWFSHLTFARMRKQIELLNIYRRAVIPADSKGAVSEPLKHQMRPLSTSRYKLWSTFDGGWIAVIVTLLFAVFLLIWTSTG